MVALVICSPFSDSVIYYRDPFNVVELENTLRGRELVLFVIFYMVAVALIVIMFESVMPVFFTDEGPKANHRRISFT